MCAKLLPLHGSTPFQNLQYRAKWFELHKLVPLRELPQVVPVPSGYP